MKAKEDRRHRSPRVRRALEFLGFTMPAFLAVLAFVELPFIMSFGYSFTNWNGLDKVPQFVGLANYKALLLSDPDFLAAFGFTLLFTVIMVAATNAVALFLAVVLDGDVRGKNALRAAFFVPNIISLIVIGYVWRFIFSKGFDSLYAATHLAVFRLSWLGDPRLSFASVVFVSVWQAIGFYMVVYIAGLQTVPRDLMEAAVIDGAGRGARFFRITLPMILPSITICLFYSISNSLKTFDVIFSLTFGGPGSSTSSIALDIYKTAFGENRFGYGAAKSVALFVLILVVTVAQLSILKRREVEA